MCVRKGIGVVSGEPLSVRRARRAARGARVRAAGARRRLSCFMSLRESWGKRMIITHCRVLWFFSINYLGTSPRKASGSTEGAPRSSHWDPRPLARRHRRVPLAGARRTPRAPTGRPRHYRARPRHFLWGTFLHCDLHLTFTTYVHPHAIANDNTALLKRETNTTFTNRPPFIINTRRNMVVCGAIIGRTSRLLHALGRVEVNRGSRQCRRGTPW